MVHYIEGTPRDQLVLFNNYLDEILPEDSPARFIDYYVNNLNLFELGFKIPKMKTGAPPYSPVLMLKIYIYSYFEKIRSSRKIEKECRRNQELIWLTCNLAPDFKTIADFRKDNKEGLKNLFVDFLRVCKKLNLISFKLAALDGTKIRAQNGNSEIYKRETIDAQKEYIEKKIEEYVKILDKNDKAEGEIELNKEETGKILKKLGKLEKRSDKIEIIKKMFESDESLEKYFATDPSSRFQSDKGQVAPGYNAQVINSDKNKIILANGVTNESNDSHQMSPMIEILKNVKEELGVDEKTTMIMDAGYHNESEILKNKDDNDVEILVQSRDEARKQNKKNGRNRKREKKGKIPQAGFRAENFSYDKEKDVCICPMGEVLKRNNKNPKKAGNKYVNSYVTDKCLKCKSKSICTRNKNGRQIYLSVDKIDIDNYFELMKTNENMKKKSKRKEIVEHQFGTIKRNWGFNYFMQRGIEEVRSEFSFICFLYNFKRVLNIVKRDDLYEALQTA